MAQYAGTTCAVMIGLSQAPQSPLVVQLRFISLTIYYCELQFSLIS